MARSFSKGMTKKIGTDENRPIAAAVLGVQADGTPESGQSQDWEAASRESVDGMLEDKLEEDLRRRIAERAFLLYEGSGFRHGNDLEHWLEAERKITTLGV